jgi:hypothetical protein
MSNNIESQSLKSSATTRKKKLECDATPISCSVVRCVSRLGVVSFPVCGCVCVGPSRLVGGSLCLSLFAAGPALTEKKSHGKSRDPKFHKPAVTRQHLSLVQVTYSGVHSTTVHTHMPLKCAPQLCKHKQVYFPTTPSRSSSLFFDIVYSRWEALQCDELQWRGRIKRRRPSATACTRPWPAAAHRCRYGPYRG